MDEVFLAFSIHRVEYFWRIESCDLNGCGKEKVNLINRFNRIIYELKEHTFKDIFIGENESA